MSFWKNELTAVLESDVLNMAQKAQYEMNDTWYDCVNVSRGTSEGRRFLIFEIPASVSGVITGLRIVDSSSNVMGEKEVSITKMANRTFSFRINFKIDEREVI